jgi:hypothetical protein
MAMHHYVIAGLLKVGRSGRLAGPGQLDSSDDHYGEGCQQWPGHQAVRDQPPSRDATCPTRDRSSSAQVVGDTWSSSASWRISAAG